MTLVENIVLSQHQMGPYHTRVLRILKINGYLTEKQIQDMCLLPARDTRAIINKLIQEGLVNTLHVPQAGGSRSGAAGAGGPTQLMYGMSQPKVTNLYASKIMHAILNLTTRFGELGSLTQITREFNTLYSFQSGSSLDAIFR